MSFYDTQHCQSEAHCTRCRDEEGGREWRRQMTAAFDGPEEVDFVCIKSKPWGFQAPRPQRAKPVVKADGRVFIDGKECIPCSKKRRAAMAQKI